LPDFFCYFAARKIAMKTFTTIEAFNEFRLQLDEQQTIGFVPTMGALHEGHIELAKNASNDCSMVVVSIFVNPSQFNNAEDLKKYPRTLDKDLQLLELAGVEVVFTPNEAEMYPEPDERVFDFSPLDTVMEGKFRPGHFNGVGQIVSKLFDIVKPNKAYFGEKDFQQLAIIQKMVKDFHYPIDIVPVAIVREDDGLAMSSRNMRLTEAHRDAAPFIYQTLTQSLELFQKQNVQETEKFVVETINSNPFLEVEYFEIVDAENLQAFSSAEKSDNAVGCIAVFAGEIRLIDNIRYNLKK
jgi:pantoate--beta-alanine ligase